MAKIKVDKHDYLRVILTEVLPYEVPITFLNEGLYFYLKQYKITPQDVDKDSHLFIRSFLDYSDYTKPYNYRINKNSNSKRLLSVPHPSIQRQISDFYEKYDSVITGLCSKSPVSLRAPSHVASRYYEKELAIYEKSVEEKNVETESGGFENTSVYASSYFTYRKYNFLYKFYDSYESHRIASKRSSNISHGLISQNASIIYMFQPSHGQLKVRIFLKNILAVTPSKVTFRT